MSKPGLQIVLSPELLPLYDLQGQIAVVIDVLRATSTICVALENGAKSVIPVSEISDCENYKGDQYRFAGERNGQKVEGFNFGNSPFEYMDGEVDGKELVLTTTNGTRSIELSKDAQEIVIGSFLNLDTVISYLLEKKMPVTLVCAGWKSKVNLEDTLFAGAVASALETDFEVIDDAVIVAMNNYRFTEGDVLTAMKSASHYQRLIKLGVIKDIEYCLTPNQSECLPILENGHIINKLAKIKA